MSSTTLWQVYHLYCKFEVLVLYVSFMNCKLLSNCLIILKRKKNPHKKINHTKLYKLAPEKDLNVHYFWFVYILIYCREDWVLVYLAFQSKRLEPPVLFKLPEFLSIFSESDLTLWFLQQFVLPNGRFKY